MPPAVPLARMAQGASKYLKVSHGRCLVLLASRRARSASFLPECRCAWRACARSAGPRSPATPSRAPGRVCRARTHAPCPCAAPPAPLRTRSPVPGSGRAADGPGQPRHAALARLAEHQVPVGGHEQVALQAARDARREGVPQRRAARATGRGCGRRVARPPGGRARARSRARPAAVARLRGARRRVCARVWRARAAAGQRGVH